jgi:hypothetical protein
LKRFSAFASSFESFFSPSENVFEKLKGSKLGAREKKSSQLAI